MKKDSKKKKSKGGNGIVVLAYAHRYGILLVLPLVSLIVLCIPGRTVDKTTFVKVFGYTMILDALWTLVGYLLKWKHIYCSYQDAYHEKMTPDNINWQHIRKSDAYGIPIIFFVIGGLLLLAGYLNW